MITAPLSPPPDPPPTPPPGLEELSAQLIGWLKWAVIYAGLAGLLICALMIIIGRRNRSALSYEGLLGSMWVLGGLGLASVVALVVGAFQL